MDREEAANRIATMLRDATLPLAGSRPAVLFSGGVDSTTIAKILLDANLEPKAYSVGFENAEDTLEAAKAADALDISLKHTTLTLDSLEKDLPEIASIIPDNNTVKMGVGIVTWFAAKAAANDNRDTAFSGLGSEEIFAGYERHALAKDINEACREGLAEIKSRDLDRDNAILSHFGLRVALPFLNQELVEYALSLPADWKLKGDRKKIILREASLILGVPEAFALRKKRAAQYGSRADWALEKLAKKNGYKYKSKYVEALA